MADEKKIGYAHLAKANNATLAGDVGSHSLHLYMMYYDQNGGLDSEISMHLSLAEVEELIKGLKHKLILCYESRVKRI